MLITHLDMIRQRWSANMVINLTYLHVLILHNDMSVYFPDENIRVRNFIGFIDEQNTFPHTHRTFLYTHFIFSIEFNEKSGEVHDS